MDQGPAASAADNDRRQAERAAAALAVDEA